MKATRLGSNILLLEFKNKKEMNLSCFRITEFCEGPDSLKEKRFDVSHFVEEYSDETGYIKYFSYWEGHNFSKSQLEKWSDKHWPSLSDMELNILNASDSLPKDGYIISMVEGDKVTLRHELAHALFNQNEEYRNKALVIIDTINKPVYNSFELLLSQMNYNESVIKDEMHAYLTAFDKEEFDEEFPLLDTELKDQIVAFDNLFNEYNTFKY